MTTTELEKELSFIFKAQIITVPTATFVVVGGNYRLII